MSLFWILSCSSLYAHADSHRHRVHAQLLDGAHSRITAAHGDDEQIFKRTADGAEQSQITKRGGTCCCTAVGDCSIAPHTWSLARNLMRQHPGEVYVEPPGPTSRNRCCTLYYLSTCGGNETEGFREVGDPSLCGDGGKTKPGINGPYEFSVFVQAKMIRQIKWNKNVEGAAFSEYGSPIPTTYYQTSLIICPFGSDRKQFQVLQGDAVIQFIHRVALRDGMKCVELRYDASQEKAYMQEPGIGLVGMESLRFAGPAMLSEDTLDNPEDAARNIGRHYLGWSRCFGAGMYNAMKNNNNHFVYRVLADMGLDARRSLQEFAPEVFEVDPNMFRIINGLALHQSWVFGEQDSALVVFGAPKEPSTDQLKDAWLQANATCND